MNVRKNRIFLFAVAALLVAPIAAPVTTPIAKDQPMPFRPGESLNYRVSWAAFTSAAQIQLSIPERRDLFGWQTWHFRATAHTQSPVSSLFAIDDQFDSYTDTASLESRQFESHLDELGKTSEQVQHLVPTGQRPKAPGSSVVVDPGTRDALGALFTMRGADWSRTPELRIPVYTGRDIYEMRGRPDGAPQPVTVPAGVYNAQRITIAVFQSGKELPKISLAIWLANDPAHTPVVMQATLPFGNVRAELTPEK
jgi:Protein of unknown function (DUF3108)